MCASIKGLAAYWFIWLSLYFNHLTSPELNSDPQRGCPYYVTVHSNKGNFISCPECPPGTEPENGFCRNMCPENYTRVSTATCASVVRVNTEEPAPSVSRETDARCPSEYPTTAINYPNKCFTSCPEGFLRVTPQSCIKIIDSIMSPEYGVPVCKLDKTSPYFKDTDDSGFAMRELAEECKEKKE